MNNIEYFAANKNGLLNSSKSWISKIIDFKRNYDAYGYYTYGCIRKILFSILFGIRNVHRALLNSIP